MAMEKNIKPHGCQMSESEHSYQSHRLLAAEIMCGQNMSAQTVSALESSHLLHKQVSALKTTQFLITHFE